MIFSLQSGKMWIDIPEKRRLCTWLTAVARYQALSHIRDIRYHDYVSLDDVEPVGDSDVKSRLFDEEEMLEFQSCWRFCRRKTGRYSPRFSGTKKAMRKSGRR